MERLNKLEEELNNKFLEVRDCMQDFKESPTQFNRNEIIRKMAGFCKIKNDYMACLRNLYLRGNNAQNLKYMKNVRR